MINFLSKVKPLSAVFNKYKWYVVILVIVISSVIAYSKGYEVSSTKARVKYLKLENRITEASKANKEYVIEVNKYKQQIADMEAQNIYEKEALLSTLKDKVNQGVQEYIKNNNNQCVISNDFGLLHDKAARGSRLPVSDNTDTSTSVVGEGSSFKDDKRVVIKDGQLLEIVTDNYNLCNKYIDRLEAWQEYYKKIIKE